MADITPVLPTHYIDEGRTILNNNDAALNADINSLNSILSSHTHDNLYYRKSEVDNIKKRFVIPIGLPATTINTWGKIGEMSMSENFGIVMPYSGNIVDMIPIKSDGRIPGAKIGFPLAVSQGSVISIVYRRYSSSEYSFDYIDICVNGTGGIAYVQTWDSVGQGPGLGNYIVNLIIEF